MQKKTARKKNNDDYVQSESKELQPFDSFFDLVLSRQHGVAEKNQSLTIWFYFRNMDFLIS